MGDKLDIKLYEGNIIAEVKEINEANGRSEIIISNKFDVKTYMSNFGSKVIVNVGDKVSRGQILGYMGNTGNSFGAHLHFEIRYYGEKKDPMNYVKNPN